ncbi:hypothetical protein [Mycolicibacterium sp. F2034L]|uniref:hypothetical protein n=1 Tax=Mycolicibacterium sp. F2034L TaxID=2926422 RepID=UPI001FF23F69|nr:hypothetical protein [Mycolicibacterium sp. F2034L]MCK0173885.1 hypothetical protein [Mycolicibacterium sp. F2034L]
MAALVDFCTSHRRPQPLGEVDVPLAELAERVMASYWPQLRPFEGVQLRQSTQALSRIFQALEPLRSLADSTDDMPLSDAAAKTPALYRRAKDEVLLCLAQQPLPRLQRLPRDRRSDTFLYDDSFLHDRVLRSELERHNNAIRLRIGVADGLAENSPRLMRLLTNMWTDDVLRLNQLSAYKRTALHEHLFGLSADLKPTSQCQDLHYATEQQEGVAPKPPSDTELGAPTFASRLNYLFSKVRDSRGQGYSSGEIAAKVREAGVTMTVSMISQLRSGMGPPPSERAIAAVAKAFKVEPSYFIDGRLRTSSAGEVQPQSGGFAGTSDAERDKPRADATQSTTTRSPSHRVFLDDMDDIASACAIRPNSCWLAPSNGSVRCRARRQVGSSDNTMEMSLHRWSWMVDHGLTNTVVPTELISIRRRCDGQTCCNPQHLFATNSLGDVLTPRDVAILLERIRANPLGTQGKPEIEGFSTGSLVQPPPQPSVLENRLTQGPGPAASSAAGPLPLKDNLESIAAYCTIDAQGCWVIPRTSSVPCRATGDDRPDGELPKIAPHRWAWMVANGRASNPLPSSLFQVWKNCGNKRCCNPDHLYLTDPDGEESSVEEAEEWLRAMESSGYESTARERPGAETQDRFAQAGTGPPHSPVQGGRHRAPEAAEHEHATSTARDQPSSLAGRLNALFDDHPEGDGGPLTSSDVAAALQEDGLTVSKESIDRIRTGATNNPSALVLEALAYFFNVDLDYFASRDNLAETRVAHDRAVRSDDTYETDISPELRSERDPELRESATTPTTRKQEFSVSTEELGRIVVGLSEAISECAARSPAEVVQAARLALVLAEVGAIIGRPSESRVIGRPLLERIVRHLTAVGYISHARQSVLPLLTALLESD